MTTLPVPPMLVHSTDVPPVSVDWTHQVKFDGVRCILANSDGAINLWSRHGTPCTHQFPEFQSLRLPPSVMLDGELIVVSSGWTDFEAVMERFMSKREQKIVRLASTTPAHFVAFDILNINGDSVMSQPLRERQALLSSVVEPSDVISVCQSFDDGQALFESTRQLGWEGIVSKRLDSPYRPGVRSKDWLKAKHYIVAQMDVVAVRREPYGLLVEHDGRTVGVVELVPASVRREVSLRMSVSQVTDRWIYAHAPVPVEVRYSRTTKKGKLRDAYVVRVVD